MEYLLPDPKDNPLSCLVLAYKVTKEIPYDDRGWDRVHWARTAKAAKVLLEICGSVRVADSCLVDLSGEFKDQNLSWTLETIVKHAHEWLAKKKGPSNGNSHRARFFKALSERGRSSDDNPLRKTEGTVFDPLGSLEAPEQRD